MPKNIIASDSLRVIVEDHETSTSERIEIADNKKWIPLLSSLTDTSTLLLIKGNEFDSLPLRLKTKIDDSLSLQSDNTNLAIKLEIKFVDRDLIHFKYDLESKRFRRDFNTYKI